MKSTPGTSASGLANAVTRRSFLQTGALGAMGWGLKGLPLAASQPRTGNGRSCIVILNVGGVSHLDTFDMKPDAPREIRGPFKPIRTNIPDIQVSELFPHHARIADKFSLVRGCYHTAPAVHDAGLQVVQTGHLTERSKRYPHIGCVTQHVLEKHAEMPLHVVLPGRLGQTGGYGGQGQNAGFLGESFEPVFADEDNMQLRDAFDLNQEPLRVRERYGSSRFGKSCLAARRLVERGIRFVTLNTFQTVFNEPTWDIHGFRPFSTFPDLRNHVAPVYDRAYSALIEDLFERGLLNSTLVVALSEFGRTPQINAAGGRDHWPHCWTTVLAGGGTVGGRVVGGSDSIGAYPDGNGFSPGNIHATIYQALGIRAEAASVFALEAEPIRELFPSGVV